MRNYNVLIISLTVVSFLFAACGDTAYNSRVEVVDVDHQTPEPSVDGQTVEDNGEENNNVPNDDPNPEEVEDPEVVVDIAEGESDVEVDDPAEEVETEEFCGNGILEDDEQCDDGNDNSFDGCNNNCQIGEYRIVISTGWHSEPVVATFDDGGFVVVWLDRGQTYRGQIFDENYNPGPTFWAGQLSREYNLIDRPFVETFAGNRFLVGFHNTGDWNVGIGSVFVHEFERNGNEAESIMTYHTDVYDTWYVKPTANRVTDDLVVITWIQNDLDEYTSKLVTWRFGSSDGSRGVQHYQYEGTLAGYPRTLANSNGGYSIIMRRCNFNDTHQYKVESLDFASIIDQDPTQRLVAVSPNFLQWIDATDYEDRREYFLTNRFSDGNQIGSFQIMESDGSLIEREGLVGTYQTGTLLNGPIVESLSRDKAVVIWSDNDRPEFTTQIKGRIINRDGDSPVEFGVSRTEGSFWRHDVAAFPNGRFVIVYKGEESVWLRIYDSDGSPVLP